MGPAHIFIDNSNILGGAQKGAKIWEGAPWPAVRIELNNFFDLVEAGYDPVTKVMAGSVPPSTEALWKYTERRGYDVALLKRVEEDDGTRREQAVDEILHLKIANAILDHRDLPQTLVLVTGDGSISDFGTSFYDYAVRALRSGWHVEVVSWRMLLHGDYERLREQHPEHMKIWYLDNFYLSLTYLIEGDFHHGDHQMIRVEARRSTELPENILR